jgi:hypothetical protein
MKFKQANKNTGLYIPMIKIRSSFILDVVDKKLDSFTTIASATIGMSFWEFEESFSLILSALAVVT